MSRKKIVAANWKLHKTPSEGRAFANEFSKIVAQIYAPTSQTETKEKGSDQPPQVIVFPTATGLESLIQAAGEATNKAAGALPIFEIGAQNCFFENSGAFTGETSPKILADMGAKHVLVGHSERRVIFKETNEWIAKKVKAAQSCGLTPMLCIGETLDERKSNKTFDVLKLQLIEGLKLLDKNMPFSLAYEPVWAIGTGQVATAALANEAHSFIRQELARFSLGDLSYTSILYGGSVKPENAKELIQMPEIDGFLVGGASLDPKSFAAIVAAVQK